MMMSKSPEAFLKDFDPIRLEQMGGASLTKRSDTKFIFHRKLLQTILEDVSDQYRVLEIDGVRLMSYKNQYFDTESQKFYIDHHNGKKNRTKIRIRQYEDSKANYLEIKQKRNTGRMEKVRRPIKGLSFELPKNAGSFINAHTSKDFKLYPTIQNRFQRFTLVNREFQERITFDLNLGFMGNSSTVNFDHLVIAEIKQNRIDKSTKIFRIFRSKNITPYRVSKYCIGMASLHRDLKQNTIKEKIRKINKIIKA